MARTTKAVLEQQVAALQAQIEDLQAQLAHAKLTCEHAAEALAAADAELAAHRTPTRRVQRAGYVAPAWQAERAQAMAAAKAAAIRMGRTVAVAA
jgi:septal ring factor EnvC (AmiA/AmiB activator)